VLEYVEVFIKIPQYGFYGQMAENVNYDIHCLKLGNAALSHFFSVC